MQIQLRHIHFFIIAVLLLCTHEVHAEVRTALVVGNAAYKESPLTFPANDAKTIANVLQSLEFNVTLLTDVDRNKLRHAIRDFTATLKDQHGVGLFYYGGHALQIKELNYMMPLDADVVSSFEIPDESVEFGYVINAMIQAGNELNIVMFDGSPEQVYSAKFSDIKPGLAFMDVPDNMLLSYSASPNNRAAPVTGQNSEYARQFLKYAVQSNVPVEQVFKNIRIGVEQSTDGKQVPWQSTSLSQRFVFASGSGESTSNNSMAAAETSAWELIKTSENIEELEKFMKEYPASVYRLAVQQRIRNLKRSEKTQ